MTAIVWILIGLFCIPFIMAEWDKEWSWMNCILGLAGLALGAVLFL